MTVSRDAKAMGEECPVCFCALQGDLRGVVTDNSLVCPNGHKVCTGCMRRLVEPCDTEATGFCYRCPMCREEVGLSRLHMMVLVCGTWGRAQDKLRNGSTLKFRSERDVRRWTAGDQVMTV